MATFGRNCVISAFFLNDLNDYFAALLCSASQSCDKATSIINTARDEGFTFKHVSLNDVIVNLFNTSINTA